ncbi:uncharacterized protein LOC116162620 isoform X4 [Photinus pyralis]|uniref:uncharacterized protein LOC116162620 isoform X4 n=1 Tax=Photinus pyralis TaxID=7054 RepID=UPI001267785B|nr:uncharacterized protein LOC116162620 isoform X4 [Photinus pyralis]
MGQCVSRKAAGAFAASAATTHKSSMNQHKKSQSPDYDDNKETTTKNSGLHSKGVATSFGFRRRPVTAPAISDNATAARRLAKQELIDRNGNGDTASLANNAIPPGRTTPRLAPPRKEANATRVSRFGFRKPNANRLNRVADLNVDNIDVSFGPQSNNNRLNYKTSMAVIQTRTKATVDSNDNKTRATYAQPQLGRYTLQSSQLPRPQMPVRVVDSKSAKQLANNNRRAFRAMQPSEDSSKEGSMTEDSGVGSHSSAGTCETDTLQGVELLDISPTGAVDRKSFPHKAKHYEMVVSGKNFDLRDLDDTVEPSVPLPQLPSAFQSNYNTGFVRERRLEYEKHIEKCRRKISITSSEGFSDDYVDGEVIVQRNECNNANSLPPKNFLKPKSKLLDNSSNLSSDEQEWGLGGEAMADDVSYSFSSSDESKDRESMNSSRYRQSAPLALQNLMNASTLHPRNAEIKNVLLTIEDPKFAAVAAASNNGALLEDETSPVDSLICSYSESEEIKRKYMNNDIKKNSPNGSSSNSKDINEKLTSPSSPGTPTNASNSLSLSDGKDYFDDEIADQPALVFDDTIPANEPISTSQQNSENTPTLMDSTPKLRRKQTNAFEYSPLLMRKRTLLHSRTDSVDTLSPCESITSDDLMLDYEQSQGSGVDEIFERSNRRSSEFHSFNETLRADETQVGEQLREWAKNVAPNFGKDAKSTARSARLLRSRASTPNSISDSPHSVENRVNSRTSHSVTRSPMRLPRPSVNSPAGYDSDDSIKIDRSSHGAMVQDIVQMKTMLFKLKRVLNEQADEDCLKKSETLNPFENQCSLKNGLFNGLSSEMASTENVSLEGGSSRLELADLRRQVLFLQGQLDDRDQMINKLITDNETAKSAPASTISYEVSTVNAATQTDRLRPISAGPSLLQVSPTEGNVGSLVRLLLILVYIYWNSFRIGKQFRCE